MKNLLCTLILMSSFSAFATGEDRNTTTDAVMCQTELGKTGDIATDLSATDEGRVTPL